MSNVAGNLEEDFMVFEFLQNQACLRVVISYIYYTL